MDTNYFDCSENNKYDMQNDLLNKFVNIIEQKRYRGNYKTFINCYCNVIEK